jgi:plasmid stabilization system protein ParE
MRFPIAFLPEAEEDIESAHNWYEQQLAGLGEGFLEAFHDLVERLRDTPQMYGIFRRDIRAAPLRRFPYVVYYRARTSDVLIIAVQRGQRSPRAWRGRV